MVQPRHVAIAGLAALCALAPSAAPAQMGTRSGPGMMEGAARGSGPETAQPDRSGREPETIPLAQMSEPMGHRVVPEPFYRESTFLVLAGLVLAAVGVAGYRVIRFRWRRRGAGAGFVTEAVLVIDLVASTHLATHYGDGLAMKARTALKDRTLALARRQGLVFAENTGDGYFMTFESVAGAVRTGFALLADLQEHPPDLGPAPPLEVRAGVTYGEILLDARGARHGAVINKAFRLEAVTPAAFVQMQGDSRGAEIPSRNRVFLGEEAAEEARSAGLSLEPIGFCALKGFAGLHRVYQALP